jgi:hypothetical protein
MRRGHGYETREDRIAGIEGVPKGLRVASSLSEPFPDDREWRLVVVRGILDLGARCARYVVAY